MTTVVTYDVQQNHTAFKQNLFKFGFYNCVKLNNGQQRVLPNTTVFHSNDDVNEVIKKWNSAVSATSPNPGVEKVLFVPNTGAFNLTSNESC